MIRFWLNSKKMDVYSCGKPQKRGEKMGQRVIKTLDTLFKTWKPREKYEFINVNEVKDKTIPHKLVY